MSAFDMLERQLRDSAWRRYRRRRLRLVPAVAALAAAAALFAVLLPGGEDPTDERPATALPAATWTPVLGDAHRGHATISRSPVPPEQLRALAILRRPPTAADRSPAVRSLLRYLGPQGMHGVRVDAIRLLAQHGQVVAILVPMERAGQGVAAAPGSTLVQHDALCVVQTSILKGNPPPGTPPAGSIAGAGVICRTTADLRDGHVSWPAPPFGLVPDGVAAVKLRIRGGRSIVAPVGNNVYDLTEMGDAAVAIQPPRYLDADGHEIPRR